MSLARRFTPALAALFAAIVVAAVVAGPASPASAHDALASSDPVADSVLDIAPTAITLTFTAEILADPGATAVIVNDASGAEVQAGAPVVDGTVVKQPISKEATSGAFLVTWRVVSSDGHPISGEFSYTVDAPAPTPSASVEPSAEPSASATPKDTPSAIPAPGPSDTDYTPWGIAALIALGLSAALAAVVLWQRRSARDARSSSGGPGGTPEQPTKR